MILFLDFDGVLHPRPVIGRSSDSGLFSCLELLEDVLRQLPHVEVVISSAWRTTHTLDHMRHYFSKDLRDRVIGMTPEPPLENVPEHLSDYTRHAECVAWLAQHRPAGEPWLAIDDMAEDFAPRCRQLLLIDGWVGLDAESAARLLLRLKEAGQ